MGLRDGLGDSYRKGEVDGKKTERSGSRAYQKFFEDYEEITIPKKNGKGTAIRRIYRGSYYRLEASDARWYARKVIYPLLAVVSCLFFGAAAFPYSSANRAWYVNVPQAVTMAVYLWLLVVLCFYIAAPRNVTVYGWKRGYLPMKKALKAQAAAILATAAATLLHDLFNAAALTAQTFVYLAEYLLGAGMIAVIYCLESRAVYGCYAPGQESV